MSLFLTGTQSFIGKALIARCEAAGAAWTGVDAAASAQGAARHADIRDPRVADLIPEGATVVHLAAISRDPDCRRDPREAFDINVTGTLNLIQAAKARKAAQFIFASSEWVYGDVANDEVQREDRPIDVTGMKSEYALTKIVGEQCLRLAPDLVGTILRFGIVYGPRPSNWSAVETLFHAVQTQDELRVGSLATARRFIHVEDIVAGILAARGRQGFEILNLSGDRPISLGEVIATSSKILGRTPRVLESDPDRPSVRNPDNAKAKATLNWKPALDLEAGLRTLLTATPAGAH